MTSSRRHRFEVAGKDLTGHTGPQFPAGIAVIWFYDLVASGEVFGVIKVSSARKVKMSICLREQVGGFTGR